MFKDFIHFFVLSCHQATSLIEKRMHTKLTCVERCQLKLHLHICDYCAFYEKEALFIDKAMRKLKEEVSAEEIFGYSDDELERAKGKFRKAVRENRCGDDGI